MYEFSQKKKLVEIVDFLEKESDDWDTSLIKSGFKTSPDFSVGDPDKDNYYIEVYSGNKDQTPMYNYLVVFCLGGEGIDIVAIEKASDMLSFFNKILEMVEKLVRINLMGKVDSFIEGILTESLKKDENLSDK